MKQPSVRQVVSSGGEDENEDDHGSCSERKRREMARRRELTRAGKVLPVWVAVCRTFREYGGPEEGGWYYDCQTVEEVHRAWDFPTLLRLVRRLVADNPTDPYGRFSVLGNSGDVTLYLLRSSDLLEQLEYPATRPHYE